MTKSELKRRLENGKCLSDVFFFTADHRHCFFKSTFSNSNNIIYIPDVRISHIPLNTSVSMDHEIEDILDQCYTGRDLIQLCAGDADLATELFERCRWQQPGDVLDEMDAEEGYDDYYDLPDNLRKAIIVKVFSPQEELAVTEKLHAQLARNQDYKNERIALSRSADRDDGSEHEVHLYIFNDAVTDPEITI